MYLPASFYRFPAIWLVDFEFQTPPGGLPIPVCLVATEYRAGRIVQTIRLWHDELRRCRTPPYPIGPDSLFVAYLASAELSCHLVLGWGLSAAILDLNVEFRWLTNGLRPPHGYDLPGAMLHFGLDPLDAVAKKAMQQMIDRGEWVGKRSEVLDYCQGDVKAMGQLLPAMADRLDLPRALYRGRYMKAVARMERAGVPIDLETLTHLRAHWETVQGRLIAEVDSKFHVFEGRTFKRDRWENWVAQHGLIWPRLESGRLAWDDSSFREMARCNRDVALMHELRVTLSKLRLNKLAVGPDGRNRVMLSPFRSKTGRNQPSNAKYVFGPATWIRGLIKPRPGWAIAYVDWEQQEFGVGAALSGDAAMIDAYLSGDPYLAFAKQIGLVPPDGLREDYDAEREICKSCILGTQYGMGPYALAQKIGKSVSDASDLLQLHRRTYARYWKWSDDALDHAMFWSYLPTVLDWRLRIGSTVNPRSIRNYPCQANGAELLRLLCILATEAGIRIVAPVHDAVLIEAPIDEIEEAIARTRALMARASEMLLRGFILRTDPKVKAVCWPDRYMDKRGRDFWDRIMKLLPR
jgi:hypothetical protein